MTVILAPREREIVRLCVAGRSTKWIADHLMLAGKTVDARLNLAGRKMGVADRNELKVWVLQHMACLDAGVPCERGLHPQGCQCDAPYCYAMRRRSAAHPVACRCTGCYSSLAA